MNPISLPGLFLLVLALMILFSTATGSDQVISSCHHRQMAFANYPTRIGRDKNKRSSASRIWAKEDSSSSSSSSLPPGFNPFKPSMIAPKTSSSLPGPLVNLRKMRLTEITSQLIQHSSNNIDSMKDMLQQHKDFLLEPLEKPDTVLEADSIYKPNMTRKERYRVYQTTMQERIQQSNNPQARKVLTAMMEFVLSYQ